MKSKAFVPLLVGLVVGIFAVSRGLNYIKSVKGAAEKATTVPVVRAHMEIPHGVPIMREMLTVKKVSKDLAPQRHFSEPNEILERVTCMMIPKDMPVLPTMLAPPGTVPGLGSKIPEGMRAVAVKVDEWSAVGGWLKPGVRVDVAAAFAVKDGRQTKSVSKIILQNIEVAAVGGTLGTNPQDTGATVSRSVTLIVKPADVPKLHLAASKGKIQLAMRNSLDDQKERVAAKAEDEVFQDEQQNQQKMASAFGGLLHSLFGEPKPEPVVQRGPQRCVVDLINGAQRQRLVFVDKDSMELVGAEGTAQALSRAEPSAYGRRNARSGGARVERYSFGGGSAGE